MKPVKTSLFFSLGTISTNAWSNADTQNEAVSLLSIIQQHALLLLGIAVFLLLALIIKLISQNKLVKALKDQITTLESSTQNLESIIAEQAETIAQAKKNESANQITRSSTADNSIQSDNKNTNPDFDEALIDITVGVKKVRGKEERYQSLLEEFISRDPNLVTQLTEYVGKSNMQQAKEFANNMKEATGDLALDSLHFCLEDLENALIEDDLAAIHQKLVDLGRAWRITEREVQKYLHTKSA